jgi:aryl-alcohol dehydrogenase-like predicted oxidoreductase
MGRTGMDVPVIGMGTWRTLDVRSEHDVEARRGVVDAALAAGTSLFDTSPMYGQAESVLARAVEGRRASVLIADKVWTSSPTEGREQARRALAWYGDKVDIYQIHNLVARSPTMLPIVRSSAMSSRSPKSSASAYSLCNHSVPGPSYGKARLRASSRRSPPSASRRGRRRCSNGS